MALNLSDRQLISLLLVGVVLCYTMQASATSGVVAQDREEPQTETLTTYRAASKLGYDRSLPPTANAWSKQQDEGRFDDYDTVHPLEITQPTQPQRPEHELHDYRFVENKAPGVKFLEYHRADKISPPFQPVSTHVPIIGPDEEDERETIEYIPGDRPRPIPAVNWPSPSVSHQ